MTIIGNYELVARLATGGMAETHVARSLIDGSIVVIKQLLNRYAGNTEFIEMFVDEGRVISSLKHPNVVGMREFGFHNELPFLAMDYLHGVDLRTLSRTLVLRRKQHIPVDIALYVAASMCAGLHHAHDARTIDGKPMDITHRDVSPQNVVLTFEGEVKLIDFGIATARGRMHETRSGALKGKIPYMAPEQVRAGATDRRTDVYATGVVLYEMLTARRPYVGKQSKLGEFSLMMAIVNHEIVPLETIRDVPPALGRVVMNSIAADPNRRYQTAAEMQDALLQVAKQINLVATAPQLERVLADVFGQHRIVKSPRTSQQVRELVSTIEDVKTRVDETHDPSTVEHSELTPLATTGKLSSTDQGAPPFDDLVIEIGDSDRAAPIVDKIVEANVTRLRFHRAIEPGFRWGRLFDGIEGVVEVDFAGVAELTSPSITAASDALRGLGEEVSEIRLIAVPIMLAMELEDRCRVVSVTCRGSCSVCQQISVAMLEYDDLRTRLATGAPLPCVRCGHGLVDIELGRPPVTATSGQMPIVGPRTSGQIPIVGPRSSIRMLVAAAPVTSEHAIPRPAAPTGANPSPLQPGEGQPAKRLNPRVYVGISAVAFVIAVGALVWKVKTRTPAPPAGGGSAVAAPVSPDDWTIEVEGTGATEAEVLAQLQLQALRAAVAKIESELPERIRGLGVQPLEPAVLALDSLPEARFQLEPRTVEWDRTHGLRAKARYAMTAATHTRLRTYFGESRQLGGLELVNAPPSRAPGVVVVGASGSGVVRGDRVISIGGRRVRDLSEVSGEGASSLELVIEHREQHTIAVRKDP